MGRVAAGWQQGAKLPAAAAVAEVVVVRSCVCMCHVHCALHRGAAFCGCYKHVMWLCFRKCAELITGGQDMTGTWELNMESMRTAAPACHRAHVGAACMLMLKPR